MDAAPDASHGAVMHEGHGAAPPPFRERVKAAVADAHLHDAIERATVLVGPALILTSVVLACGLAVTVFSDLPSLRLFGWLAAFSMLAALAADLMILRPTAMFLNQLARRLRKPAPRGA